jgi:type I restriction enzyme S subunit
MTETYVLKDLIGFSRDGEWGESEPFKESVEVFAIRGTDFDRLRTGDLSTVPIRFMKQKSVDYKKIQGGDILIEAAGGSRGQITGRTVYIKPETLQRFGNPVTNQFISK